MAGYKACIGIVSILILIENPLQYIRYQEYMLSEYSFNPYFNRKPSAIFIDLTNRGVIMAFQSLF